MGSSWMSRHVEGYGPARSRLIERGAPSGGGGKKMGNYCRMATSRDEIPLLRLCPLGLTNRLGFYARSPRHSLTAKWDRGASFFGALFPPLSYDSPASISLSLLN